MIIFDLQCARGHQFEGWFDDAQAFEDQKEKSLISCPVCNDSNVSRIPSAFAIRSPRKEGKGGPAENMAEIKKKVSEYLENNFDNVGTDFAKEALRIHYGVTEPRNIRGVSTPEEEKVLKEEGIGFFKIPSPARPTEETVPSDADLSEEKTKS
ncbi:MAG: DUF1178 family protein [Desulfobacterales bacterium]